LEQSPKSLNGAKAALPVPSKRLPELPIDTSWLNQPV
jgi:hypothetical protein